MEEPKYFFFLAATTESGEAIDRLTLEFNEIFQHQRGLVSRRAEYKSSQITIWSVLADEPIDWLKMIIMKDVVLASRDADLVMVHSNCSMERPATINGQSPIPPKKTFVFAGTYLTNFKFDWSDLSGSQRRNKFHEDIFSIATTHGEGGVGLSGNCITFHCESESPIPETTKNTLKRLADDKTIQLLFTYEY